MRGRFQAEVLLRLEEALADGNESFKLADHFQMVAGTSTGAIIAAAVACRFRMQEVVNLFDTRGRDIFSRKARLLGPFAHTPPYDNNALRQALVKSFRTRTLGSITQPALVIASSFINKIQHHVFSNIPNSRDFGDDKDLLLRDVVASSCSAPGYFASTSPEAGSDRSFVDGGLWANDPSLVAAIYAKQYLLGANQFVKLLAIGNGKRSTGYDAGEYDRFNSVELISPLVDLMFGCQATSAQHLCELHLGQNNYLSIDLDLPRAIRLDDVDGANKDLSALAPGVWGSRSAEILAFIR